MKLNIQLFASLNVGDIYETTPVGIKPYGSQYTANAYEMKMIIKLNSQNLTNFTSNITITSYMRTLANSWGWSGFSNNIYMERYVKENDDVNYTKKNETDIRTLPRNNYYAWVDCGSWSGDIHHKADGTCTFYAKTYINTTNASSYSYIPRATEQISEAITVPQLHKNPTINITGITELNTYLGVANNVFVQYLSKKQFAFTKTLYDSATTQGITISNGSTSATGTTSPITLDFTNKTLYTTANVIPIKAVISDSLGSTGTQDINYTTTPIMYIKPSISSSTSVRRNGQTSGKAYLNLNATFYNGTIGSTANTIEVNYRFWEKDTTEPNTWNVISNPTISGNNITVSNYEIGTTDTSASNYFNPQKAYNVKIYIKDAMRNASGTYMSDTTTKSIPLGESVWDEYKDRLRIKKAQIDTDIINPNLDLFNDTSGSNWKDMIKNKLDYCVSNMKTSKYYMETFINGGWSGVNYGLGLFSKIGTNYQLSWFYIDGYKYVRKVGSTYSYYSSNPDILYDNSTGIQSRYSALIDNLSSYKKLAITFTMYKNSNQANTGGTAHICWLDLTKKDGNGYARSGIVVPYSSAHLTSSDIQSNDFKALFEANLNNNRVYCSFAYNGVVQQNSDYVMTKIEGYYN